MPHAPDIRVLVQPGLGGSGRDHWQSLWERTRGDCHRIEQDSWHDPEPSAWSARIEAAVRASPVPVVVAAHSLGCVAVAHWAATRGATTGRVAGALLVAPCDVERPDAAPAIARFRPLPPAPLPFRSTLVASSDDPYATLARARCLADRWGSAFVDFGPLGHINAASGLDEWPEGQVLLEDIIAAADAPDLRHLRAAALRSAALALQPDPCRAL